MRQPFLSGERCLSNSHVFLNCLFGSVGDSGRMRSAALTFYTYTVTHNPVPTPVPKSLTPPPTPPPTPTPKSSRNCCVYLSTLDYTTKNCVSFNMDCPVLETWVLSSVEAGVDNCKSKCSSSLAPSPTPTLVKLPTSSPTPTPSPTSKPSPTPAPILTFRCCWYLGADHVKVFRSLSIYLSIFLFGIGVRIF